MAEDPETPILVGAMAFIVITIVAFLLIAKLWMWVF